MEFKYNLHNLRIKADISSVDLAKNIGVAQPTISEWEKGKKVPSRENLKKLAKYFNVTMDYLLGNEEIITHIPKEIVDIQNKLKSLNKDDLKTVLTFIEFLIFKSSTQ